MKSLSTVTTMLLAAISTTTTITAITTTANAADIYTYTNDQSDQFDIPLGYTVPLPVDSLTPIDGFRRYQSLNARHQQLASEADFINAQIIGQTLNGEDIWLYTVSDSNGQTRSGADEGATLINGGIHAREWQSPEAVTGFIENLFDHADDQYIEAYLIDNLKMMFIPVLNIDGFRLTQRFPTQVTRSVNSPRDGRMRRKNLRDVNSDINTGTDDLLGVDLNRNNAPFWATTTGSSASESSLVYHGTGPASEPEIGALINAANAAPPASLRLYLDVHSFGQVYFPPMTGNSRRDSITAQVMDNMRAATNFKYANDPIPAGLGFGTTADYFAATFGTPSATMEIEPGNNGAADYGGNGVSHDGFILPNNQVRRMVRETSLATFIGFYTQAEKPMLQQVQVFNQSELVVDGSWSATANGRTLAFNQNDALQNNITYRVNLQFNKPMRWLDNGVVSIFPSRSINLLPTVQWQGIDNTGNTLNIDVDTTTGSWLTTPSTDSAMGFNQYQTDTFSFTLTLPDTLDWQQLSKMALTVDTMDMVRQSLDANPATITNWTDGHWNNYENSDGNELDSGGVDRSFRLIDDGQRTLCSNASTTNPNQPSTANTDRTS